MNTIAHAYSVVAFLLILGCTLIGFPVSVFSQSDDTTSAEETVEVESEEILVDGAVQNAATDSQTLTDNYPREKLPSDQSYSDFVVGPGRFVLELAPGESETVEMVISNRMGADKVFSLTTEDTAGSADGSQAVVLLGNQKGPYTLRDYLQIPHDKFLLKHGERARVPVTVSLPADAEPGGHYGSLIVSIVSNPVDIEEGEEAKPSSVVVSRIGTLFFVSTPGSTDHEGKLQKFSTIGDKMFYNKGPVTFGIVTENTGSVHLAPYGNIKIFNMLGSEVGSVDLDPWFVMPKSLRIREVSWNRDFMIGRYTAVASISRGYDQIVDEETTSFWVIPWMLIAVVFGGLFIFFLLLRFVFSQFEFKRRGN